MRVSAVRVFVTLSLALAVAFSAAALELPLPGAAGADGKDGGTSVFVGFAAGTDSNVTRSSTETDDSLTQVRLGARYKRGNSRTKFDLGVEYDSEQYSENPNYDKAQTVARLYAGGGSAKVRGGLSFEYGRLADAVDTIDVLERTSLSYAPSATIEANSLTFGLGYGVKDIEHADTAYRHLDNVDSALVLDASLGRDQKFFVHYNGGGVEFEPTSTRSDFSYAKTSFGWRGVKDDSWSAELSFGQVELSDFSNTASLSETAPYMAARLTKLMSNGRTGFDIVYLQDAEAAATAEMKKISRFLVRYSQNVNDRWGWLASVGGENSTFVVPDAGSPDSLSLMLVDVGLQLEIGSPNKTHGRAFLTLEQEMRTGSSSSFEYDRIRLLLGVALVY